MELFDVLNEDGSMNGKQKTREQVHHDGDWHGSVRIWLIRGNVVLLQKRAMSKDSFPGCYDVACSGHIDAGEDPRTAAIREVAEEIGLSVHAEDLTELYKQRLQVDIEQSSGGRFISNEWNTVFILTGNITLNSLSAQQSEIESLHWIPLDELGRKVKACDEHYCISFTEYERVRKYQDLLTKKEKTIDQ